MKRPLTLIAGILGLVSGTVGILLTGYVAYIVLVIVWGLAADSGSADMASLITMTIMFVVPLMLTLIATILNGVSIGAWKKDVAGFKKRKGVLIAAIVFNFLATICGVAFAGAELMLLYVVSGIFAVITSVLFIVDLALEGGRRRRAEVAEREYVEVEQTIEQ